MRVVEINDGDLGERRGRRSFEYSEAGIELGKSNYKYLLRVSMSMVDYFTEDM